MLTGRRFVLCGLSRLTVRVAEALVAGGADVVVVGDPEGDAIAREAASNLEVPIVVPGLDHDDALRRAGLADAAAFLALAEDDLANLRAVGDAHELAPDVPCVVRTFRPELAEGVADELNIRRAYSVAAFAAPAIVAAALGEEVVETLRLGDDEVPLCVLDVRPDTPLDGQQVDAVTASTQCAVVAVRPAGGDWVAVGDLDPTRPLTPGDQTLVGGRLLDVLRLALDNDAPGEARAAAARRAHARPDGVRRRLLHPTLLRVSIAAFVVTYTATLVVNMAVVGLDLNDAATAALGAALGNTPPPTPYEWVQWFDLAATVAGVVLLWVLLSHVTALVLAERFDLRMNRRARRMHDHVVVVGLGRVGYRVVQLLGELDVPVVVLEETPDSRFLEAVAVGAPVLTGDGSLPENLERTGIDRARCVIACTNNDLANLSTCFEARRRNPSIRTVIRAFDPTVARRLSRAFGADAALSSTDIASHAFVGAAIDVLAMRPVVLDGLELAAFRVTPDRPVGADELDSWRAKGLRVLAVQRDGAVQPPTQVVGRPITADDEAVVIGPAEVVRAFATDYE